MGLLASRMETSDCRMGSSDYTTARWVSSPGCAVNSLGCGVSIQDSVEQRTVMSACKREMLDCRSVTGFHSGWECTGSEPETKAIRAVVTKPDCIRDCSRCPAARIPQHRESFPCRSATRHPCTPEFHLVSRESSEVIPYCCSDLLQPLQTSRVLYEHHHANNTIDVVRLKMKSPKLCWVGRYTLLTRHGKEQFTSIRYQSSLSLAISTAM